VAHNGSGHPRARSEGLLVEHIGDETVLFDTATKQAHCLSPLAAAVFAAADGGTHVEQLADVVGDTVGEPVSVEQVEDALAQLEELALLVAPPVGLTRRTMMRRTAVLTAAATATPLVTSVVTPAYGAATRVANCPQSKCASQAEGDDYCACLNTCPTFTGGVHQPSQDCAPFENPVGPFYDSCECHRCPFADSATDPGQFPGATTQQQIATGVAVCSAVYGPNYWIDPNTGQWHDWTQNCSASDVSSMQRFGCTDTGKSIDGACFNDPGDSTPDGLLCEAPPS
jgi:hypothetical protein